MALSTSIWAVAVLPLTTAITLAFAQVFFVALLAMWLLKETVGIYRIGAVIVGFIGVIVVMRPGVDGLIDMYALIPLVGALGAAFAIISVRKLSQTESTATLVGLSGVVCWNTRWHSAILAMGNPRFHRPHIPSGYGRSCNSRSMGWSQGITLRRG